MIHFRAQHFIKFFILTSFVLLAACGFGRDSAAQSSGPSEAPAAATPTTTPTPLPPRPRVEVTPVPPDAVSPLVVQRYPRRGQELGPAEAIELVFDRPMAQTAAGAFSLQTAAESPQAIAGQVSWADARTLRFAPAEPLPRAATFDAILTQAATAEDGAPLAEPFTFRFNTAGYLEVGQVIPADGTVDVETDATITVMFNRPVVPLTSLNEAADFPEPLTFEPAIAGQGEWLNTSIYIFRPAKDLPGGVTFTARVKSGLTDVSGQTLLADDFTWQFATQPPEVVSSQPNDGQTLVPIESAISLSFNQPVDPQSAQANLEMSATGLLGQAVSGDFQVEANTLTFTPTEQLKFDTTYQVTMQAGVTSVAGGQGMAQPYSFRFTTVPLPKVINTEPVDGEKQARPYTDFRIFFNTPINPTTVMDHIEMAPSLPITPTLVHTWYNRYDNSFSFNFDAKPSTDYTVRIKPGIEDPYGNSTRENLTVRFRTAPLRPNYQLRTPDRVGTYDADLPAKVVVGFVNVTNLNLSLYRLDPADILRPTWEWNDYKPGANSLIREWTARLEAPADKQTFQPLDLVEGGGPLEPGLYFLDTDSPQVEDHGYWGRRHLLVVSPANLTLKAGPREALVWATALDSGQPLSNLPVIFYNDDRQQLGTAVTDADGLARLDLPDSQNRSSILAVVLPQNGQPFAAVSENWARGISPYEFGLETAYNLPDYAVHIYTDRPIYRPDQTVDFKGLLRAEDDVRFRLPDVGQVQVQVMDAAYETIFDETLPLSPGGTFNGQLELGAGAALGQYTIAVNFGDQYFEDYFQVAAYRPPEFEVAVEPDATERERGDDIAATITASYFFGGSLTGADVTWNVLAETYTFEPAQFGSYTFTDSDDPYTCLRCWWWRPEPAPQSILSGSGQTDANGQLTLNLTGAELDRLLPQGSHRLIIEATVTGPDNQFISGQERLVYHKGDYYIGLSPQEYVADAGQETAVDLVAVDWAADRLPDKLLDVQIMRYDWVNTFVETGSGGYWEYQTQKTEVDRFSLTTDSRGEAVARFTPPQGGSYRIIAQDGASLASSVSPTPTIRSSVFLWVAGEDDVSWRRENHDRLTLISDKVEYTPGETAEILIPSPFEGEHTALVTVERGRIHQTEVIKMAGSSHVYNLPITADQAPNIYVSVVLVQGRDGPRSGDQPRLADYKLGILPLDVTPVAQTLNISLTPDVEQAEPDSDVTYTLQVTDADNQPVAAEFSLDLVDKAVLSLQPRQPDEIVQAFYHRRGLAINTATGLAVSMNQLLLELAEDLDLEEAAFVAEKALGGAEMPAAAAPMPTGAVEEEVALMAEAEAPAADQARSAPLSAGVEVRQDFSDTAYWNPVVTTDANGEAQVSLTLPDNLTTWVMRGVGLTNDTRVGEATVELVSTKPLLVRPVAPRFLVVDDRAELAANVNNNTDEDLSVEVTLSAAGVILSPDSAAVQTVTIPARSETKVTWDVSVTDAPQVDLVFAAASADGQYSDAAKPRLTTGPDGTLQVFRYTAPDIVGTAGQLVTGGSRTEAVALPPNFDDRRGELSLQLDPSLAAGMRDGLRYLEHYEYECTEQTVSRFLPNVLTYDALQSLGIDNKELADNLPGLLDEGLSRLYTQQKPDGGWGWWAADESNVHVTAYVVFALTRARLAGVDVSATVLANGQNFLLNHLQAVRQLDNTFQANRQAFVLYALAEDGAAPADALESLFAAREKLSHYGRAYLALSLSLTDRAAYQNNIDTLLSDINNAAILSATGAHWEEQYHDWWAMNTDTRSTAIILDALARLDPQNELIPNVVRWLMVAREGGIWETTQETAWALIALTDWMVETGELEANYDYSVFLNDAEQTSGTATPDTVQESVKLQVPVADLLADASNLLTVARSDGNGRLYYSAHLKVYQPVEQIEPADRGVIVNRTYTLESCRQAQAQDKTIECAEVREAKLGDVIRVDLTIIAPNDLYYVVVEDPLPAGAEAIDTGLATTSLLAMDPALRREDSRFWWWWRWYSRSELRDEKVALFADYLSKGTYEFSYTMRATLPGDYHVIPTVASEFYFPEVFGRSDGRLLSIGR